MSPNLLSFALALAYTAAVVGVLSAGLPRWVSVPTLLVAGLTWWWLDRRLTRPRP